MVMKRFADLPPKLRAHIAAVVVLGMATAGFIALGPATPAPPRESSAYTLPLLLIWMILCSLARLNLVIRGATMTLGSVGVSLAQILLGTRDAMVVAAAGAAVTIYASQREAGKSGHRQPIPAHRWLFNICNCLVAAGIGGLTYDWVYLHSGLVGEQQVVPAILAWVLLYFVLNTAGVAIAVALRTEEPAFRVWRTNFLWTAPGYVVSVCITVGLVLLPRYLGVWSALLIPPVYLVLQSYRLHLDRLAAARQYEELIETARDGVVILHETRILYANKAFARMLGFERDSLVGRSYAELLPEGEAVPAALAGTGDDSFAEQILQRADGSVLPVEISTSRAVYHGQGECVQALVRDVSERLAAIQAEKLRALGQMASGVAHDFNNSLMVILGNLTLAQMALPRECRARHHATSERLQSAEQAANDAAATVRRLQAFGRPAVGHEDTVNLHELAQEVVLMTRPIWRDAPRAAGNEITVEVSGDPEALVNGNAAELREVLTNLINNAVHAMPRGGSLRLSTGRENGEIVLLVQDTGLGMTPQVRERIFEPFYTTKGEKGSGLGLFVTYGLVAQHDGQIEVSSAPGAGTSFHLRFPAAARGISSASEAEPVPRAGARVLVVDDDVVVRDVITSMLRHAGVVAGEAEDGLSALAALDAEPWDLVITDLSMPGMSGLDLAQAVKARFPKMPILLLTGWAESSDAVSFDLELVSGILSKPVPMSALLRQVTAALAAPDEPAAASPPLTAGSAAGSPN
jgi:PAS domain S-box-containing protein